MAHLIGVLCCFFLLRGNLVHRVEIYMELKMKDLNILTQIFQYILSFDYEKSWHLFEFHVKFSLEVFLVKYQHGLVRCPIIYPIPEIFQIPNRM